MNATRILIVAAAASLVGASVASADIVVEFAAGANTTFTQIVTPRPASGADVVIPVQTQSGTYRVRTTSVTESIGMLSFSVGGLESVGDIIIAPTSEVTIDPNTDFDSVACANWGGFDQGAHRVQVQAYVSGDITGPVTASNVVRLRAGGGISGAVTQTENIQPLHSVRCEGAITGAISAPAKVNVVKANSLQASISASGSNNFAGDYYAIGTIEIAGDIGTSVAHVSITTDSGPFHNSTSGYDNGAIRKITARNIYANISTPRPSGPPPYSATNKRGDIVELITNPDNVADQGRLVGQIDTFSFGYDNTDQDPSMDVHGPMEAVVNLDGTFKQPVKLRGGVTSTGVVSLREQDLTVDNEGIEVTGDMAGRIEIEGNKDAPITISGDVTGTVEIGASVRSAPAANRDYAGRLSVGGSLASTGVITVGGSVLDAPGRVEIEIADDLDGQISIGKSLAGQIEMGAGGLKGQVIINANNGTGASAGTWSGTVSVGSIQLKPNNTASPDDSAPYYKRHASDLGGGAVGLAPFHLYEGDCSPPHNDFGALPWVLASQFTNLANTPVKIVQYGPVKFSTSGHLALVIEAQNPDDECAWWDMTPMFGDPEVQTIGGSARVIGLKGSVNGAPFGGVYRVSIQDCDRVLCDGVAGDPTPVWPVVTCGVSANGCDANDRYYLFRIYSDCNGNGIEDEYETHPPPPQEPMSADVNDNKIPDECEYDAESTVCRCDWNTSGILSVQDLFDFLQSYFAGAGDFNRSGTTSVQDIFDFLSCYFGLPDPCTRM